MIINHNMAAMNTHRQLGSNNAAAANNIEKLSSGLKINKAGDDAAGLAISEKMRGQIRGLDMASKNSQDAISLVQTAEGSLNETHDILQRMRELAVQAGNDTNTTKDRGEIQKEINSLTSEVNRIGNTTEFNTQKLLDGSKDSNTVAKPSGVGSTIPPSLGSAEIPGVKGTYTVAASAGEIDVDGTKFTPNSDSSGDLFTKISAETDITDKYDVALSTGGVTLTQKVASDVAATGDAVQVTEGKATVAAVPPTPEIVIPPSAAVEAGKSMNFQIGANQDQSMTLDIADMRAANLGISSAGTGSGFTATNGVTDGTNNTSSERALDVSSHESAAKSVTAIQSAIDKVSAERSKLGANQNRLEHTINNLGTSSENLTAAESRIRDVDYVEAA